MAWEASAVATIKTAAVVAVGTVLASAAGYLSTAAPVNAEPLAEVCTDPAPQHHQSCEVGYLAMYIPHGPMFDCAPLYDREVALHPHDELLRPDFLAGCEAAKRERSELGVLRG